MLDIEWVIGRILEYFGSSVSILLFLWVFFLQIFKGMMKDNEKNNVLYTTPGPYLSSLYQLDAAKKQLLGCKLRVIIYKIGWIIKWRLSLNNRLILGNLRSEPNVRNRNFVWFSFSPVLSLSRTIRGYCAQGQSGLVSSSAVINNICLPTPKYYPDKLCMSELNLGFFFPC